MLYSKGVSRPQKVLGVFFMILTGGILWPVLHHDFVPDPSISTPTFHGAIAITLTTLAIIIYLKKQNLLVVFGTLTRIQKLIGIVFSPIVIFLFIWANLAITIPHLYTLAFGQEFSRQDTAEKIKHRSRKSCDYRLKLQSIDFTFFHFCISESKYNQLQTGEMNAVVFGKKSRFGYTIERISLDH
ncbi:hypothetical protein ACFW0H_04850 [Pseudomonas sp. CR3202]|uniref:hypothetical protein n=1 Tax=Pseudomonas sp. CR3202 TaxID=3351532 RepID=UPI003BF2E3B4